MKTLNQIKSVLETIATNHKQINDFGFGDIWEYTLNSEVHGVMWASISNTSADLQAKEVVLGLTLWFMDLVNKDERNELEVLSDQLQVATDVLSLLNSPTHHDDFFVSNSVTMEHFTEREDTEVSGWKVDLSLRIPFVKDTCYIPD